MDIDPKKKSGGGLTEWIKVPFERFNQTNNFDDFACSPPHGTELMCGLDTIQENIDSNNFPTQAEPTKTQLTLTTTMDKKFKKPDNECTQTSLASVAKETFFEACLSAGTTPESSSADCTPVGSPNLIRKNPRMLNGDPSKASVVGNPKRWFYSGFLMSGENAVDSNKKKANNSNSFKTFSVTNFDINAIGPTSW